MASGTQEYVYLSGKVWRAELFQASPYNKYNIKLNLDNPSLAIVLDLKKRGIKNVISKDDDGYWITLSSPSRIDTRKGPTIIEPPAVVNPDGSPWDRKTGIGDGSDVTCKVWVRKYKNPNNKQDEVAIRLFGVMVDNLVPFDPKRDFHDDARKRIQTDGLKDHGSNPW